jgi:hypothetical protein
MLGLPANWRCPGAAPLFDAPSPLAHARPRQSPPIEQHPTAHRSCHRGFSGLLAPRRGRFPRRPRQQSVGSGSADHRTPLLGPLSVRGLGGNRKILSVVGRLVVMVVRAARLGRIGAIDGRKRQVHAAVPATSSPSIAVPVHPFWHPGRPLECRSSSRFGEHPSRRVGARAVYSIGFRSRFHGDNVLWWQPTRWNNRRHCWSSLLLVIRWRRRRPFGNGSNTRRFMSTEWPSRAPVTRCRPATWW